jgi:hypothetical protein
MLWKWKLARDLDDVLHLLNGETRYDHPVPDARVCMTWRGDHPQFWVFATKASKAREPHDGFGGWGWRVVGTPEDALRFLRGEDPGADPVGQAQVAAVWTGRDHRFYVFYRRASPTHRPAPGDWGWRLAGDADDVLTFLNGEGSGGGPLATARIATVHRDHHDEYYVFHRDAGDQRPGDRWSRHEIGSADGVRAAVDRKGHLPMDFQVVAPAPGHGTFQLFTRPGGTAPEPALASALSGERLVHG